MQKVLLGLIGVLVAVALLAMHQRNTACIVGVPSAFLLVAAGLTVGADRPRRTATPAASGRRVTPRRRI